LLLVAFSFSRIASGTSGPFYIDSSAIGQSWHRPPEFQSDLRQGEDAFRQNVRFGHIAVGKYVLIEQWGKEYNQVRPHSALGYRPPAPEKGAGPTARILVQKVDQLLGADYEPRGFQEAKRR